MPTYTYFCEKCKKTFEIEQSIKSPSFRNHREADVLGECDGKVKRILHPSVFKLNGSGFYVNDYKKPKEQDKNPPS